MRRAREPDSAEARDLARRLLAALRAVEAVPHLASRVRRMTALRIERGYPVSASVAARLLDLACLACYELGERGTAFRAALEPRARPGAGRAPSKGRARTSRPRVSREGQTNVVPFCRPGVPRGE